MAKKSSSLPVWIIAIAAVVIAGVFVWREYRTQVVIDVVSGGDGNIWDGIAVTEEAFIDITKTQIGSLGKMIEIHQRHTGSLPKNLEDLTKNSGLEGWQGPYTDEIPLDPWESKYNWDGHRVWSSGPDRISGTEDDVRQLVEISK